MIPKSFEQVYTKVDGKFQLVKVRDVWENTALCLTDDQDFIERSFSQLHDPLDYCQCDTPTAGNAVWECGCGKSFQPI